jgi:hypothetical protein
MHQYDLGALADACMPCVYTYIDTLITCERFDGLASGTGLYNCMYSVFCTTCKYCIFMHEIETLGSRGEADMRNEKGISIYVKGLDCARIWIASVRMHAPTIQLSGNIRTD